MTESTAEVIILKLTRERDNARRDRDAIAAKFADYQKDKRLVDKALWMLAHDFAQVLIAPEKAPGIAGPNGKHDFMALVETIVAKCLIAAQKDTGEWESDDEKRTMHQRVAFRPPAQDGEVLH